MGKSTFDMSEDEYNKMLPKCKQVVEHSEDYLKGFEDCKSQMLVGINNIKIQFANLYASFDMLKDINPE